MWGTDNSSPVHTRTKRTNQPRATDLLKLPTTKQIAADCEANGMTTEIKAAGSLRAQIVPNVVTVRAGTRLRRVLSYVFMFGG